MLGAERLGEEIERRGEVGARQPRDSRSCASAKSASRARVAQRLPEMAGAVPGEREELVLVEPDQRRLQQAGEVEVVLRQQHEARHGEQVLDGELLAEVQAVDARHLDLLALQLAHQGVDELVAPADQHHEVAGMQQLALARTRRSLPIRPLAWSRDQPRQPLVRRRQHAAPAPRPRRSRSRPSRRRPAARARPGRDPGLGCAGGDHLAGHGEAVRRDRLLEHPVDRVEHRRRRAERDGERHLGEVAPRELDALGEPVAHLGELGWIGALEAEDRLLGVADHEDGALARRLALSPAKNSSVRLADHLPLVGIGVLRLVDQHMVDAAVELVEHPGSALRRAEQPPRGDDQVVVVEHAAPPLGRGEAAGDVEPEPQQRQRQLDQRQPAGAFEPRRPRRRGCRRCRAGA